MDARLFHGLSHHLGHHDVVVALNGGLAVHVAQVQQLVCQVVDAGFNEPCALARFQFDSIAQLVGNLLNQLVLLLSHLGHPCMSVEQLAVVFRQLLVAFLQRAAVLFHLVEHEQGLVVARTHVLEVLLQRTVVGQQLLLFVDAVLVVFQQFLSFLGLRVRGLHLEIEGNSKHDYRRNQN